MPEGYLTTAAAAADIGVQPRIIQRHIQAGRLAAEKMGRQYIIARAEWERYKAARRGPGRPRAHQTKETQP
jgi:excisionase family DNA binding protein